MEEICRNQAVLDALAFPIEGEAAAGGVDVAVPHPFDVIVPQHLENPLVALAAVERRIVEKHQLFFLGIAALGVLQGQAQPSRLPGHNLLVVGLPGLIDPAPGAAEGHVLIGEGVVEEDMQAVMEQMKVLYEARIADLWRMIDKLTEERKTLFITMIALVGIMASFIVYLFVDGMHGNWGFFQY